MNLSKAEIPSGVLLPLICSALLACEAQTEVDYGEPPDLTRYYDTAIGDCSGYDQSALRRDRPYSRIVYPQSDWMASIESAAPGTEILLEDGVYQLSQYAVRIGTGITIRSLNADPSRVRIRGMGYDVPSEGFMVLGNDVVLADLSISNIRNHAIAVNPNAGAERGLLIYNMNIADIGTQHIKVNPGGASNGLIACSTIGYSEGGAVGDYNGAIDLHSTVNYTIRDNYIYNIAGDGSGCNVDQQCGQYISAPAILAWNGAANTRVIGNTIVDSFRNITFGIGNAHYGGSILHNTIEQSRPGDAGIELYGASDAIVEFNTVKLSGNYPGAIEYRESRDLRITNNWVTSKPWDRGGNQNIQLSGNAYQVSGSPRAQ